MKSLPFEVRVELDGWTLFWAFLSVGEEQSGLPNLRDRVAASVRERFAETAAIATHPPIAAMRRLFRGAGCDPTRYRPSSEALARRVLKGDRLPRIHPCVDLNNALSLELMVPCCVVDGRSVAPPFVFRAGREGETMLSMRGPFDLRKKPLLEDREGPFGTPITDSERVKIGKGAGEVWLVAYLPRSDLPPDGPSAVVRRLLERAPVAEFLDVGSGSQSV